MIIVDIETTGLLAPETKDPERQPGIVQIALIKFDRHDGDINHVVIDEKCWLVNPEKPVWDPDSIKVHGIQPEQVRDAPTLPALMNDLVQMFLGRRTWVGFNNEFDRKVLHYQLSRYGYEARFPWPYQDLDIMKIAKPVLNIAGKRDVKHPNLMECHTQLTGEGFASAHDALADCRATLRCYAKLVELGYI